MLVCAQQEQNSTAKKKKPKKVSSSWIWSAKGDRADKEVVYFRKSFEVRGKKAAVLRISCDNHFEAWLNGKLVGKGDDWALPGQFEVRKDLTNGRNVLAILGRNAGGVAALAVSLSVLGVTPQRQNGDAQFSVTGVSFPSSWPNGCCPDFQPAPIASKPVANQSSMPLG